ncbi:ABC transporter substrate-binding protein [Iningainema tapete]|uniref:Peptide ABC transporter substrate-binding protein n=1 Tax=Iningainema tapete BLCC-T55 TaxID=2748662 RepID=A0A8J6XU41_9CYAN|nr:ABC transporter substrate-binding protein [Iningainema tapete]MBD2778300.1 peptide ABC transporter substrate-binding protein [Iningainema tapete BLCC-T55]
MRCSLSVKRWGQITKLFSLFCLCLFLVVSCANGQQTTKVSSSTDGRITIGTTQKPRTLDPADAYELASLGLVYNMSDRLYTYEPGSTEIKPQLATALPQVSADGLTYTIPLRQGVVFHDDTPFNAKAMAFSLQRFIENKGKPSFLLGDVVESVKTTGEYELTVKLKKPFTAFPSLLAFSGVCAVSPSSYELGQGKFNPNIFIGTGPYKLARFGPDSLQFDVFDKYWGEKPANGGINVQIFSSGVNLYNNFRKKAVDVAYLNMDPDQIRSLEELAKEGSWQAIAASGNVIKFLAVNRNQKPLDNPVVRQAIAAMINRAILSERVLYGQSEAIYSLIPTTFNVYKPVFQELYSDGNAQKAKELLTQAGFSKTNPARVELWYKSNVPTDGYIVLVLKALVKKTMDGLLQLETNSVESTSAYNNITKGTYPMFVLDWYPDFLDPDNYTQPFLSCQKGSVATGCQDGGSQTQGSFYYSDRMNKLIEQQRQEQNPAVRKNIFAEIQAQLAADVPYIPLWQSKEFVFAQNGISGVQLDPTQNLIYKTIKK